MDSFRLEILGFRQLRAAAVFVIAAALLAASLLAVLRPVPTTTAPVAGQRHAGFWFASPNTAYALATVGSAVDLYRTTNSAGSWRRLRAPGEPGERPDFLQLVADGSIVLQTLGPAAAAPRYWLSTDGGAGWREIQVTTGAGFSWGVQVIDRRTFVAVGRPAFGAATSRELALRWTHDGGDTWEEVLHLDLRNPLAGALGVTLNFSGPAFVDDRHGWAVTNLPGRRGGGRLGSPPSVLRTDDAGRSWTSAVLPGGELSQGFELPVFPGGGDHGYVIGYTGIWPLVYESLDGGQHWSLPYASRVNQFAARPDRWFSSDGGQVLISRDWGRSWAQMTPELPSGALELGSIEATGGMLWSVPVDRTPVDLLRSSDGGWSWVRASWPGA